MLTETEINKDKRNEHEALMNPELPGGCTLYLCISHIFSPVSTALFSTANYQMSAIGADILRYPVIFLTSSSAIEQCS